MDKLIPLLVAIPLAVAFLIPLALRAPRLVAAFSNLALCLLLLVSILVSGQETVYHMGGWSTARGIDLRVDGLTSLMLPTINGLALIIGVYSVTYLRGSADRYRYYCLLFFLVAGMNGVVLTADLFNLYVFVEIASIASYALVAFGSEDESFEGSFKYAIFGTVSSSLILLAIGLVYGLTGTLNMSQLAARIPSLDGASPLQVAMALLCCGFGVKAALVPFHAWLPDAYPTAPAPISALLAGAVSKVLGVYVLARLLFNVFGINDDLLLILRWMGGLSMVVGGLLALGQWDIKRMLAYSSLGQVGLIVLALGLGTMWGVVGALYHFINHAAFKPLLFLDGGQIENTAGTRDLRKMRGLRRAIPITAATNLVGSLSVAGVPPFNGFWSKLIIVFAAIQSAHLGWACAVVVMSIVTLAYQLKIQRDAFYRETGSSGDPPQRVWQESAWATVPIIVLAIGCLALSALAVTGLDRPFVIGPAAEVLMNGSKIW